MLLCPIDLSGRWRQGNMHHSSKLLDYTVPFCAGSDFLGIRFGKGKYLGGTNQLLLYQLYYFDSLL